MGPLGHSVAALTALVGGPVGLGALALRPSLRVGLVERLGLGFAPDEVAPGAVWVHAASVGEILAAGRLIDTLLENGRPVCASTHTLTGRDVMRRARPKLPCGLAPLDHPWCVAAALGRVRPSALVLVETEFWPSWIQGAAERDIPVITVSGRLSERSLRRWRRLGFVSGPTAERIAAVGARTDVDADRYAALGVPRDRIRVTGDLKLEPAGELPALAADLEAALAEVPLLAAASTHAGEEEAALAALAVLEREGGRAALLIAPRHPERFDEVAEIVRQAGRSLRRRSALGGVPLVAGEVLLLDNVGELASVFPRSTSAFVGGSLVDRGGHNVLEPIRSACPVVVGPHVGNVAHVVALLEPEGALTRVADAEDLARAWGEALADPEAARRRGDLGRRALDTQRGASKRNADLVEEVLLRSGEPAA